MPGVGPALEAQRDVVPDPRDNAQPMSHSLHSQGGSRGSKPCGTVSAQLTGTLS